MVRVSVCEAAVSSLAALTAQRFHKEPGIQWLRSVFVELFGPDAQALVDPMPT